jgi:TetR/AcrR family transcriptional repressor of bet genes
MPRPSNTTQRRAKIVQGLLLSMARHGYEGATIQSIAKEAHLAPGIIHYHFKSKQAILLGLFQHIADLVEARRQFFATNAKDARQELYALIDAYLAPGKGASPQAVAAWVAIGTEAIRQKELRSLYQAEVTARKEKIKALLLKIPAAKPRNALDAERAASGIVALMEGAFQVAAAAPKSLARGYAAQAARLLVG